MSTKHIKLDDTPQSASAGIGVLLPQVQPPGSGDTVIFDTTTEPNTSYYTVGNDRPGQSFYVGAGAQILTDVKLTLSDPNDSTDTGTLSAELWSSTGGTLPTLVSKLDTLATIPESSLPQTPNLFDVSITNGITLSADTQYWIVLEDPGDPSNKARWYGPTDLTGTTGASNQYT